MVYLASIYTLDATTGSSEDTSRRQYRYEYTMKRLYNLIMEGNMVFSPVVHCHQMANKYEMPKNYEFYKTYDRHMISISESVIVLDMPVFNGKTWKDSHGVSDEVEYAKSLDKPVIFLSCSDFYDKLANDK